MSEEKDNLTDELIINRLNFCGCGNPEIVLNFIYEFIELSESQFKEKPIFYEGKEWEEYCKRRRREKNDLIVKNLDALVWLIYCVLDEKHIFTHGGNVSGGWLEDKVFYNKLKEWKNFEKDLA